MNLDIHGLTWASWVCPIYRDIYFVLPSASDILRYILSCRAIAIYDLPINLRYIYKRVSPLEFIRVPVSCHIQYPVIFSYCPFTKVVQCQSILGYIWGKKLFSFQVFISEICSLNVFIPIKFCYFPEFCTTRNCSPCTTAVVKIGGEIFCQSWPLLTPFFNFCTVHWMMCEWAV